MQPNTPAPTTVETHCNYTKTSELGLSVGVDAGNVAPRTIAWDGFRPGENEPSRLSMTELYNCNGARSLSGMNYDAIVVDVSQYG